MIDGNPANKQNWRLVCGVCAARFALDETIDLCAGHWQDDHPERAGDPPAFAMLWVGKGPEPRRRPASRGPSGRRR